MSDRKRSSTRAVRTTRKAFVAMGVYLACIVVLFWPLGLRMDPWQAAVLIVALYALGHMWEWNERAKWERETPTDMGSIRLGTLGRDPHFTLTGKLADEWEVSHWNVTRDANLIDANPTIRAQVTLTPTPPSR